MKKIFTLIITVLCVTALFAQVPEKFTYQVVVRNASNSLVANAPVGVRVSILQGSDSGTPVYVETHTAPTNANGLMTIEIGGGMAEQGSFSDIDWSIGPFFLKTETDPNGGSNYNIISTQQLLSVPYALYAKNAGNIPTVPDNVSAFTNDAGYITEQDIPDIPTVPTNVSAFINDVGYITMDSIPSIPIVPTNVSAFTNDAGYLTSFIEQQILTISNDTVFLTGGSFVKLPEGFDGDYNSLINKPVIPTIPTEVSTFNNDAGYITIDSVPTNISAFNNDAGYLTGYIETDPQFNAWDKDYEDLNNKPTIPTIPSNVSAFTNDAGYLTSFTEQQILTISNDTVFLTGGSFVKLPEGFDGDYNSLTNKPVLFSGNYNDLTNKPSIPTVPTTVSAFTNDAGYLTGYTETDPQFNAWDKDYNDLINKPVIPTIPANVSAFTNDAGYITMDSVPAIPTNVSAFTNDAGYITMADVPEVPSNVSSFTNDAGYLTSFTEQQILTISNDTLFLTGGSFVKLPEGFDGDYNSLTNKPVLFSGNYNDLTNKPSIPTVPTNVSTFTNDAGYLTGYTETDPLFNAWDKDYNDLTNKPTIPTVPANISAFANDAGYITMDDVPVVPTNVSTFTNDAGYLTSFTEQQILTISNDTLFLTGGSFVKLPEGFDGDYNSLTNKPVLFSGNYNDLTDKPVIPIVPTNVSEFTNDAGYITMDSVPAIPTNVSAFTNDAGYLTGYTETDPQFNAWDKNYNDLINTPVIPTVPTDVSAFTNDAGYLTSFTEQQILTISNDTIFLTGGSFVKLPEGFDGDYNSLRNKPEIPQIPINVSAYSNDANYITNTDTNCNNELDLCALQSKLLELENLIRNLAVITSGITSVTQNSFVASGNVTADGGDEVIEKGFVYSSTNATPTIVDNKIAVGSGLGAFSTTINNLSPGITYHVRAFASNNNGTAYGATIAVTTTTLGPSTIPNVTTTAITDITSVSVVVKGAIISNGGESITQSGFCYDTLSNPTFANNTAVNGCSIGSFSNYITNLIPGKTYYVRAFAQNNVGTAYGQVLSFTTGTNEHVPIGDDGKPCTGTPTVTDHEGNVYNTVQIGNQCWTKENLRTTTSPSTGTYLIPPVGTPYTYTGKQARWFNNDSATYATKNYGLLYNYNAAIDTFDVEFGETSVITTGNYERGYDFTSNRRGICPLGWHLPSDAEWLELTYYVSNQDTYVSEFDTYHNRTWISKALASTIDWHNASGTAAIGNDQSANNVTGFSALPAGGFGFLGYGVCGFLRDVGDFANFWSTNYIYPRVLINGQQTVTRGEGYGSLSCFSVRCLKDDLNSPNPAPIDTTVTPTDTTANVVPCPNAPTVTDVDGNVYNTVQIGEQCWMAENLRVKNYSSNISDAPLLSQGSDAEENMAYWFFPNGQPSNEETYGLLYAWKAATGGLAQTENNFVQGICPIGWHVPSNEEFQILLSYPSALYFMTFTSQLAGFRYIGSYGGFNAAVGYWSSTEYSDYNYNRNADHLRYNDYGENNIYLDRDGLDYKGNGYSVRCLKDDPNSPNPAPIDTAVTPTDTTTSVVPCPNAPTVTDYDGNVYYTVQIGDQCWMNENLRTLHYSNGDTILLASGRRYPNNDESNVSEYGYLYHWYATMHLNNSYEGQTLDTQGICPPGWHVPSNDEWGLLRSFANQNHEGNISFTGFSAQLAGKYWNGYYNFGDKNFFWTRDYVVNQAVAYRFINSSMNMSANHETENAYAYFSVRCLRNATTAVIDNKSCPSSPTVTDHEGNVYATVQIGNQCWMRENLRTTTSPSTGTYLIPNNEDSYTYTGKQARWYNNDSASYAPIKYGLLYNWYAAVDTFNTLFGETNVNTSQSSALSVTFTDHRRGICPMGWHLPSDNEWITLTNYVSSHSEFLCGDDSSYIPKSLASTSGWISNSGDCCPGNQSVITNNATGFSAVPAGGCGGSSFYNVGCGSYFWSSTENGSYFASYRGLYFNFNFVGRYDSNKYAGYSVRCLRD